MTRAPLSPRLAAQVAAWPAGPKLLGLAALGTGLLILSSPLLLAGIAGIALVASLLVLGSGGMRAGFPTALVVAIAILAAATFVFEGWSAALAAVLRLVSLSLFALLVTGTTRAGDVQDALVAGLRPVERLPFVSPEKAGLALAITLRSIPRLGSSLHDLRQAQAARGASASPARLVVPLIARMLRDAKEIADAIDARSWGANDGRMDR